MRWQAKSGFPQPNPMRERARCSLHLRVDFVTHWATLHEDDGVVAILASNRCGQPQHEPTASAACDELKAHCGNGGNRPAFLHVFCIRDRSGRGECGQNLLQEPNIRLTQSQDATSNGRKTISVPCFRRRRSLAAKRIALLRIAVRTVVPTSNLPQAARCIEQMAMLRCEAKLQRQPGCEFCAGPNFRDQ